VKDENLKQNIESLIRKLEDKKKISKINLLQYFNREFTTSETLKQNETSNNTLSKMLRTTIAKTVETLSENVPKTVPMEDKIKNEKTKVIPKVGNNTKENKIQAHNKMSQKSTNQLKGNVIYLKSSFIQNFLALIQKSVRF
jgi:hypothetical protein